MIKINKKNKNGYAVLELLFYISFFVVLSLVVISSMITMARAFRETVMYAELVQSGDIMERMSREIRAAYDIDPASTNNDLKLNTKDSDGVDKTMEFKFLDSNLQFLENDVFIGNLNTPNIVITAINFTQITTTKGKAIRIILTVRSVADSSGNTQDFYDTIVLRGNY
ncbi:MAG: hypothetical protein WCW93_02575 [Candidatus Paceibacterota bacterium]